MKSLGYLNRYFWKYRYRLLLGIIFVVTSNLFAIYKPLILKEAVDFLINTTDQIKTMTYNVELPSFFKSMGDWFNIDIYQQKEFAKEDLAKLMITSGVVVIVLYLVLSIISGFFLFLTRQTLIIMSRLIEFDLKNTIFEHYQKLHFGFYKKNKTGDLMNRISEDVNKVRMYLGPAIMYSFNLISKAILAITFMVSISPKLSLYVLIPLPIMSFLIYFVGIRINKLSTKIQVQQSGLTSFVQESFSGIRILKAFNRIDQYKAFFADEAEDYLEKNMQLVKVNALFIPTIILLIGTSTLMAIFIGSKMIINGEGMTPGALTAFVVYINMLTWPFAALGWVSSMVQQAAASQTRINQFLEEKPEMISGSYAPENIAGDIHFKNVSFKYPASGVEALKGIDLKIESGKTTAIIGRTGSGKSTIANLIARLYDVDSGAIEIDGKDIRAYDLNKIRSSIGYVPQEVFLFSDNIKNNIAFGHPEEVPLDKVIKAAKLANVHVNIDQFPEKYDTLVGEWGLTLSGGQKQRVSIARALIREPKILIFDDSLSAVDTETEEDILGNLKEVMKNKTTIMISHRVSSIKGADKIIVLDRGVVAEEGTHDELIALGGKYHSTYQKQITQGVKNVLN